MAEAQDYGALPVRDGLLTVTPESSPLKAEGIFLDHYRFERPDVGIWMQWVVRNENKTKTIQISFDFSKCTGLNLNGSEKQVVTVNPEETKKVADIKSADPTKNADCSVGYNYTISGTETTTTPSSDTKASSGSSAPKASPLGLDGLLAVTPTRTQLKAEGASMDLYRLENDDVGLWMQWVCINENKTKTLTFTFDFSKCVGMNLRGASTQEVTVEPGTTKKVADINASDPSTGCECSANYNYLITGPD